ncbi:MAG TPA: carboxypeptidase-like regulatory domain-containing protein [Acidimicrobiales bacterium]|nr:carboxypeptidase-like regulatory domain-containing protein [Acidimicrobiales bacterium]
MRRLALVLMLVAAGCTGSDDPDTASPTTVAETTTVPPSTTSTTVRATTTTGPPRTTTTTLVTIGPGDATIGGTVTGPAGPVDGATVRVERLVGRSVASADVTTSAGGLWQLASILGGSYRVRAFKPPELGTSPVESFFLAATERKTIDFRLPAAGGERITAVVDPNPPRVDQPATITITVGTGRVDDQGRPVITPRAGVPLTLSGGPGIVVESPPQAVTDGNGSAAWRIRCSAVGADTVSLTVGTGVTQVRFDSCGPPVAAPTTRRG